MRPDQVLERFTTWLDSYSSLNIGLMFVAAWLAGAVCGVLLGMVTS